MVLTFRREGGNVKPLQNIRGWKKNFGSLSEKSVTEESHSRQVVLHLIVVCR